MVHTTTRASLAIGLALMAGTAVLAGCGGPSPVTSTTTTERTMVQQPPPVESSQTTTTQIQRQ
jgi:hypothetical protein